MNDPRGRPRKTILSPSTIATSNATDIMANVQPRRGLFFGSELQAIGSPCDECGFSRSSAFAPQFPGEIAMDLEAVQEILAGLVRLGNQDIEAGGLFRCDISLAELVN